MAWAAGEQLFGTRYTIEGKLGEGGFGITYLATKNNGKRVVIKTLKDELLQKKDFPQLRDKFRDEALRLAVCKHPHIVAVENTFTHQQRFCMAMEYVEGEDLETLVERQGYLSETEALQYIWQIGEALTYIHQEKGLLHRDVKPQNIMQRRGSSDVVLIDFGLARGFIPNVNQFYTTWHTPHFSPPEQEDGKCGEYTDVYALAATLYFILTNALPTVAWKRAFGTPLKPPGQINSTIGDGVHEAILQGMALDEKQRPQSVQEWLAILPGVPKSPAVSPRSGLEKILGLVIPPTPPSPPPSKPIFSFEVVTVNSRGDETNRERRQAEYFREDLGNGVFLDMVSIPGGSFMMGSPKSEKERLNSEGPQHRCTMVAFFMGKYLVTQAQWKAVAALPQVERSLKLDPSDFKGDNLPVECVSWHDTVEFCKRLSRKTGRNYRLPSEVEWEYACRAGTTTPFHFGETMTANLANYDGNCPYANAPKGEYRRKTTEVGSFPANAFGLYDMHGNVWEWCADPWHKNYQGAPADGRVWESSGNNSARMLRGGSWYFSAWDCRSAYRYGDVPGNRVGVIGFRVVCASSVRTQ